MLPEQRDGPKKPGEDEQLACDSKRELCRKGVERWRVVMSMVTSRAMGTANPQMTWCPAFLLHVVVLLVVVDVGELRSECMKGTERSIQENHLHAWSVVLIIGCLCLRKLTPRLNFVCSSSGP